MIQYNFPTIRQIIFFCIKGVIKLGIPLGWLLFLSSCRLLNPVTPERLSGTFDNIVQTIKSHPDPETIRESFPTFLILVDTLILSHPESLDLLYAGASAYDMYCQAFLANEINSDRASKLYTRAKDYGIRLLEHGNIFSDVSLSSITEFEDELRHTTANDVPYIYAAASAWLGWILTHSGSMEAIADLPKAIALMQTRNRA